MTISTFVCFNRIYGIVEILSVLLHIFVYAKIYFYKKNHPESGGPPQTSFIQTSSISSLDSETLSSLGLNLLIIVSLGSTTIVARRMSKMKPDQGF